MAKPIHCLVVESEENLAQLLRDAFDYTELLVSRIEDQDKALEKVTQGDKVEIFILDVQLSGTQEIPIIKKIQKISTNALIIIVTTHSSVASATSVIHQGAFDYLVKPVNADTLTNSLNRAIKQVHNLRQEQQLQSIAKLWHEKNVDKHKIDEHLVQSTKLAHLGELAAEIAHDINTPLTGIVGFIGLFLRFLDKPDIDIEELRKVRYYLTNAYQEAERCKKTLKNILMFSRKEADHHREFVLLEIIERVTSILQKQFERAKLRLTLNIPDKSLTVFGDEGKIQQVLMNLVVNAKNALQDKEEGRVTISAQKLNNTIEVSVFDTGNGIAPENIKKVFEPFYTTNPSGTGLGLAISKRIMKEHGGDITVKSQFGYGTTFTLIFPKPAVS